MTTPTQTAGPPGLPPENLIEALRLFLRQSAESAGKSSEEWAKSGRQRQSDYRSGMWFAYHNVENWLNGEKFV